MKYKMEIVVIDGGKAPERATCGAAGYDVFAPFNGSVYANERLLIKLKFRMKLENNTFAKFEARSGLANKYGIMVMAGVVDSDYRDEVGIMLYNSGHVHYNFVKGDRIGQFIIHSIKTPEPQIVSIFSDDVEEETSKVPDIVKVNPDDFYTKRHNHAQQPPANDAQQPPANDAQQPPANDAQQPPANDAQELTAKKTTKKRRGAGFVSSTGV